MMTSVLFVCGILTGVLAGLVPGVGVFTTLVLLYPFLYTLSLNEIFILYVPMIVISQFVGSIPALFFKIPGESTSLIATEYGHKLFMNGEHDLVALTALGSFVATVLSAFLFITVAATDMSWVTNTFKSSLLLIMILISFIMITITSKNKLVISLILLSLGVLIGNIGYNVGTGETLFTFGTSWLYLGVPLLSFMSGIYIVPQILSMGQTEVSPTKLSKAYTNIWPQFKHNFGTMINGSLLGYVCGFIPIIGKIVGVNLARFFYVKSDRRSVIAAESSNNASIFSALIPLFVFGVPITLGEILIVNIAETTVFDLQASFFTILQSGTLPLLILLSGVFGLLIAWPLATSMTVFYKLPNLVLKILLVVTVMASIMYVGVLNGTFWYNLITFFIFLPLGWTMRRLDLLPILFGFIFAKMCVTMITRLII